MTRLAVIGFVVSLLLEASGASVKASGSNGLGPLEIPEARGAMGLAYDGARREVVMFGGCCDESGKRHGDTWTWTPSNGWVREFPTGDIPGCRNSSRMAYDAARQEIVLFGGVGFNTGCPATGAARQNDTWTWNGTNWTEEQPGSFPGIRASMGLAYDPRSTQRFVVLFGGNGTCGGGVPDAICNDTWVWNGTTWAQCQEGPGQACATRPPVRSSPAMAFHAERNAMIATGGKGSGIPGLLDDTWDWRGITLGWGNLSGLDNIYGDRTGHRVAYDSVKKAIVLFGGCTGSCQTQLGEEGPGPTDTVDNDTWSLDGGTWEEKTPTSLPSVRCCGGMAFFSFGFNHVVYFMGQDETEAGQWGVPGVWYWQWNGGDGEWIVCDGPNDSCA